MSLTPRIARSTAVRRGAVPHAAPRRARNSAEATESMLLDAARTAFGEKGYVRTTVQDIIEGTGLSRGAFYRYFRSTDDIFVRIIERVVAELVESSLLRTGDTLRSRVLSGNRRYLEIFARHRGVMRAMFEARYVSPQIDAILSRMRGEYLRRLRDHLVRQTSLGRCRPIDPDATAMSLGMMVEGAAQAWVVGGLDPFEQPLDLDRLCEQVTSIWCRAVYLDADQRLPAGVARARESMEERKAC